MRIAILSWRDTIHPLAGGAEVVVDKLAKGLVGRGHEVVAAVGGPVGDHPYPVVDAGGTYSQFLRMPVTFHRRLGRCDVVLESVNGIPHFARVWQGAPVVGLSHHVHLEQWAMSFPASLAVVGRTVEARLAPLVYRNRAMIAVSSSTAERLGALGYTDVTVVEMGVSPPPLGVEQSPSPRFVVLGRLVAHKRVERAIELWEQVRPHTGGELVVVGDGPLRSQLEARAGEGVRFTGFVDDASKGRELSSAWLLVHPAHHEGWGMVIMEAAAAGVPTLAYDVDGVRNSVVDGVTGVLAQSDDDFVAAWIRLATDAVERRSLGDAAVARAGGMTWDHAVSGVEAVLAAACRPRTGSSAE